MEVFNFENDDSIIEGERLMFEIIDRFGKIGRV